MPGMGATLDPSLPPSFVLLQVTPRLEGGGVEQVTLDMARAAARVGAGSLVASWGGTLERDLARTGARLERMAVHARDPISIALNAGRLARLIRREKASLIHVRSRAPAFSALWAARATGIPMVATYHGVYASGSALKRRYNRIMTRGEAVIANSQFTLRHLLQEHGTPAGRLCVIPEGIDLAKFDPAAVSVDRVFAARRAMGLDPSDARPVILLAARLTGWKGQAVALAALGRLVADRLSGDAPVLVMAGREERAGEAKRLTDLAASAGVRDAVRLPGSLADMPAALKSADLVIAPSTSPESFGRSVAEACAMGRPVIASDLGALSETLRDGETGWLVPAGDTEALAGAMGRALRMTRDAREVVGARARARIAADFSLERMVEASFALYRQLIDERRGELEAAP